MNHSARVMTWRMKCREWRKESFYRWRTKLLTKRTEFTWIIILRKSSQYVAARELPRVVRYSPFKSCLTGTALPATTAGLTLSSINHNKHQNTSTLYSCVFKGLSRSCTTDSVLTEKDDKTCKLKQCSLMACDSFQKLWHLKLRCSVVYDKQTLRGFYVQWYLPQNFQ